MYLHMLKTGNRAHLLGLNIVGLRRANYSNELIKDFKLTFEKIFNSNEIKTESIANNNRQITLDKKLIDFIIKRVLVVYVPLNEKKI